MLCYNIHSNFAEIEIGADSGCCCDAGGAQDVLDDSHGQLPRCTAVGMQIPGHIHKDLVNRINMDILGCNVFQINFIDFCTVRNIIGHSGRCGDISQLERRIFPKFSVKERFPRELPVRGVQQAFGIYLFYPLHNLEQPCAAGYAIGFQRWGNG